jgi:hypothetical protein
VTLAAAAVMAIASATSCSYATDETPYPGACAPLHPIAWTPPGNSVDVPTDVIIRVKFDDYPDPDGVRSGALLLTTGFFWVPGTYGVELIDKQVTLRPWRPLVGQLGYTVHLRPAIGSLAGCPGTVAEREFRTGNGPVGVPEPRTATLAEVQVIFERRCSGGGCHLDSSHGTAEASCLAAPAAGLSLCAPQTWGALVQVPSRQTDDLPLVDAGDSARSYLLRKLLPATADEGPIAGVVGQREPPGPPLPDDELRAVAAWIDAGAPR